MKGKYSLDDAVFTHKGEPIDPVDGSIVYEEAPMTTVQVPTSELVGEALGWAVSIAVFKCEPWQLPEGVLGTWYAGESDGGVKDWHPESDWSQGGPLIHKYGLTFAKYGSLYQCVKKWFCGEPVQLYPAGETHLIAAMLAIVTAELGGTVNIPKELAQ